MGNHGRSLARDGFRVFRSDGIPQLRLCGGSLARLSSGTAGGVAMASFVNQSAEILSTLQISFTAEQWRSAVAGTADRLDVELIVGGVPVPLPQLAFNAATNLPAGASPGGHFKLRGA